MRFVKRPIQIEAEQFTRDVYEHFFDDDRQYFRDFIRDAEWGLETETLLIKTLEGTMYANIDDWIIKGINGEYYPCKPDIFARTYEVVR